MATREPLPSVYSSEGNRTYKLHQLIGRGGFGEVYLATPQPRGALPSHVCVKVTDRLSPWLRESYFAELLYREPRALRVLDRFVVVDGARTRYCLVMEYAKLGDFGIATHQLSRRGVTADAFNLFNVPNEIAWGRVRRWQQRDDIYQVGLIAVMLLRGDIGSPIRSRDVRTLPCSDHLKEVIHRCLGVRGKRYESAGELIEALRMPRKQPGFGRVRSLAGKRLSFTGFLSRPRSDAIKAAQRAGAIVQSKPGRTTDVLVRGRPNVLQIGTAPDQHVG